jgi:hypothetical protein
MLDIDIVKNESDMVINCTDAIFLLDDACCPGTVCELTAASMLGKRVHIFYLKRSDTEETESSLHTPCWYPIIYSILANNLTRIYECENFGDAVAKICGMVNEWQR